MSIINRRTKNVYASTINAIGAGGTTQLGIQRGYDLVLRSDPDGLQAPLVDREVQFLRGTLTCQDWVHALSLLTATPVTYVVYERNSGVAEATGYTKHTITAPVIHTMTLRATKGQYATVMAAFEATPADETKGFADMITPLAGQAAPTYVPAARGGYRIESAAHGSLVFYHVMDFSFSIDIPLTLECNDGDVGYTVLDLEMDRMRCTGSITIHDRSIDTGVDMTGQLVANGRDSLVLTVRQAGGAASQVITIAGVEFLTGDDSLGGATFNTGAIPFEVTNNLDTLLTLAGANPILSIAAAE